MELTVYIPFKDPRVDLLQKVVDAISSQSYPVEELLLIDDGSTKPEVHEFIAAIEAKASVRVVRHSVNLGVAAARNTAVAQCRSALLCAFDADIIPEADCVERLVSALRADSSLGGVGGRVREFYTDTPGDRFRAFFTKQDRGEAALRDVDLFGGCTLYVTSVLRGVGGYFSPLRNSFEDFDMSQRVRKAGFATLYNPEAKGWHHKRDSIASALDTLWRWSYPHWEGESWIFSYDWLNNPEQRNPPEFFYEQLVSESFARLLYKVSNEVRSNVARIHSEGLTEELRFLAGVFLVRSILKDVQLFYRLNRAYDATMKRAFVILIERAILTVLHSELCAPFGRRVLLQVGDLFSAESVLAEKVRTPDELTSELSSCALPEEALAIVESVVVALSGLPELRPV